MATSTIQTATRRPLSAVSTSIYAIGAYDHASRDRFIEEVAGNPEVALLLRFVLFRLW